MTELSVAKQLAITRMIEGAPDAVLRRLSAALQSAPDTRMAWIRGRVLAELGTRRMRGAAFGPLIALFRERGDGVRGLSFPSPILNGLWRQVRDRQRDFLVQAEAMTVGGGEIDPRLLDILCLSAASALRDEPEKVWVGLDARMAGALAACFDLAPLARRSAPMLGAWIGRGDPRADAALRLMMQDAAMISEDAAPRMLEILFANLTEPGRVLRLVSRIAGTDGQERFLARSDMADFGDRLLERLEAAADAAERFVPAEADLAGTEAACSQINQAAALMIQMEQSLDLTADGDWGARFQALKHRMGKTVNRLLARCPRAVDQALPLTRVRVSEGTARMAPDLDAPTSGPQVERARRLMQVLGASRRVAPVLGCAGLRMQVCETLEVRLSAYGDEIIEALNAGAGDDEARGVALAMLCAEFLAQAEAEVPARTLMRRLEATGAAPRLTPSLSPWAA